MTKNQKLWLAWGFFYLASTFWGFIPNPPGVVYALFLLTGLGFFVPPGMLIYRAIQRSDRKILKQIALISLLSLILTVVLIVLNFLSVRASLAWGNVLYWLLIIVSAPMVCTQIWVISLFGWACLLMTCLMYLKKK